MNLRVVDEKKILPLATKRKPANRKYSQQHSPMAGSFHLVGHSNKTCQENKARYFMPTYILGIKDSKASSFILILNPQKENLQIILAPNFTILVAQHQEIFILPLCIIIFYCLYFLHFLCDH